MSALPITGDEAADRLLEDNPLALLVGMLLDQQVPMEWAFRGPATLHQRLGKKKLTARAIASLDEEELVRLFCLKPAMHRYPAVMARRTHALCRHLVETHAGDPVAIWRDAASGAEVLSTLRKLPGFGDEKARIMLALLAKRFGIKPRGWKTAAAPFSDTKPRSAADVSSPAALEKVRAFKRAKKAEGKGKSD